MTLVHELNQLCMAYDRGEYGEKPQNRTLPKEFVSDITNVIIKHYNLDSEAISGLILDVYFRTSNHSFGDDICFVLEQHKKLCKPG